MDDKGSSKNEDGSIVTVVLGMMLIPILLLSLIALGGYDIYKYEKEEQENAKKVYTELESITFDNEETESKGNIYRDYYIKLGYKDGVKEYLRVNWDKKMTGGKELKIKILGDGDDKSLNNQVSVNVDGRRGMHNQRIDREVTLNVTQERYNELSKNMEEYIRSLNTDE